ncbi:adenosylcobinamide-phosphate synthase CbiB [Salinigranum marinum]|uniref:adenosylcobinamide-phosphate synthase CbiB n=1 Tax=Salinigranum marinum TaxID=1515595 RepID=UPI002989C42B|nr:adenosylcobinamide-phosphate synthase CbiB [Salinigranum marinum]
MPVTATAAVGLAALLDRLVAEPPASVHPVALFGRLVAPADRAWPAPTLVGSVVAVSLPLLASGAVFALIRGLGFSTALAALTTGLVLFSTTSLRLLTDEARRVVTLSNDDLPAARTALRSLAGRDASALSGSEVRSAAVESLGENLADGLVAPLAAFALVAPLSLAGAAAAATWVKAVNTLDSMLGYPHKPHGTASARLDDLTMWLPARLTAVLIAAVALDPGALSRARKQARNPPSPNSGWPMATLAAVLGVALEKPGVYVLDFGSAPSVADARRAGALVTRAGLLAFALAGVVAWF